MKVPSVGSQLEEVEVEEDKYKSIITIPNAPVKIEYKHLTPLGKLISRIISYNLLPKTGTFTHISIDTYIKLHML